MMYRDVPTEFAPSARSSRAEVRRQSELFKTPRILRELSNAVADMMLVLNTNRQIVHANKYICEVFNVSNEEIWLGLRPGEAMQCVHAIETDGGCGTTKFCKTCGSARAILSSQRGGAEIEECRITQEKNAGSLDLSIAATPIRVNGEDFTVFSARDITGEKRREALERIFFHDVLNTAGGLRGYLEVLETGDEQIRQEFYGTAQQLMKSLIDEILSQQELSDAERGDLVVSRSVVHGHELLNECIALYENHEVAQAREILLAEDSRDCTVMTDKRLLQRVLGNMIKNALEATEPGGTVTAGVKSADGSVVFSVHNEKAMPEDVRLQLFQRSFSTKGPGRGLGTYSIKLIGERYLGGRVGVTCDENVGTTFSIALPLPE